MTDNPAAEWLLAALVTAVAVLSVFAAGGLLTWFGLAVPRIVATNNRGQAALNQVRAEYSARLAKGERAARRVLQAEQDKAKEADLEYRTTIERIKREADARPPRFIRLPCPGASPGAPAHPGAPGDPGQPAKGPADGSGMGLDGASGYRDVDVGPIYEISDAGKAVSAQVRGYQALCR